MEEKIRVLRANPAGNITLFVLSTVAPERRAVVAAALMRMDAFQAEQVGYVIPADSESGDARLEMAGGEFCGNASRAFGLLLAKEKGITGALPVSVSGCAHPVLVKVDVASACASAEMPLPLSQTRREVDGVPGTLVDLGGIAHFVVHEKPSRSFFAKAEALFEEMPGLEAYGVIFLEADGNGMTPLVKVRATDTIVFEGSCGSGSFAAAVAESQNMQEGLFRKCYEQPAGDLEVEIERSGGAVLRGSIGGSVSFDEPVEVTVTL